MEPSAPPTVARMTIGHCGGLDNVNGEEIANGSDPR